MKYISILALATAFVANAAPIPQAVPSTVGQLGRVDFISTDDQDRIVNCAANPQWQAQTPKDVSVPAGQTVTVQFPEGFQGNCWANLATKPNVGTGMLAEIAFGAWEGLTYFDVSGITALDDTENVYAMVPGDSSSPISGCMDGKVGGVPGAIACKDNIYVLPDDVQTKTTPSNYLKVYIGPPANGVAVNKERSVEQQTVSVGREFIEGRA